MQQIVIDKNASGGRFDKHLQKLPQSKLAEMAQEEKEERHRKHLSGDMDADGLRDDATVSHVKIKEVK